MILLDTKMFKLEQGTTVAKILDGIIVLLGEGRLTANME